MEIAIGAHQLNVVRTIDAVSQDVRTPDEKNRLMEYRK
jgi:hypothetical protein